MRTVAIGAVMVAVILVLGYFLFVDEAQAPAPAEQAEPQPEPTAEAPVTPPRAAEVKPAPNPAPPVDDDILRVEGVVTDASTRLPIAGAVITAEPDHSATTDEVGAYALALDQGRMTLTCTAEGYATAEGDVRPDSSGQFELDFQLEPAGSIRGFVRDAGTGAGVAGVEVYAMRPGQARLDADAPETPVHATSDEDGAYAITGLQPGRYVIAVNAVEQGYLFRPGQSRNIRVNANATEENVNFELTEGAVVRGTVRNAEGAPVPNAHISAMLSNAADAAQEMDVTLAQLGFPMPHTLTQADGSYELLGVWVDREVRVSAEHEDYAAASSDPFRLTKAASPHEVELTLTQGSTVSGTVMKEDETPVADEDVLLMPAEMFANPTGYSIETTDDAGKFVIDQVPAGEYIVMAAMERPYARAMDREKRTVTVDGVSDVSGLEIIISPEAARGSIITGIVVDQAGEGVADATVTAEGALGPIGQATGVTDDAGRFEITGLRDMFYDLSVVTDEGAASEKRAAVGSDVRLQLQDLASIEGTVLTADGAPCANCPVTLQGQRDDAQSEADQLMQAMGAMLRRGDGPSARTDDSGAFTFSDVEPGTYVIEAESEEHGHGESVAISVVPGETFTGARVYLKPGIGVGGTVTTADRAPVAGATVTLTESGDAMTTMMTNAMPASLMANAGTTTTDENGEYFIENVRPGEYTVVADHVDYAKSQIQGVAVEQGPDMRNLDIVLTEGGRAVGTLTMDGEVRAGTMVTLVGSAGVFMAMTDSQGNFNIDNVPPGTYMVQAVDMQQMAAQGLEGMTQRMETIEIADGQATEVDLGPPPNAVTVSGAIEGAGEGTTTVVLRRPGSAPMTELDFGNMNFGQIVEMMQSVGGQTIASQDGVFTMEGVEPGDYILEVYSMPIDVTSGDFSGFTDLDLAQTPHATREVTVGPDSNNFAISLEPEE